MKYTRSINRIFFFTLCCLLASFFGVNASAQTIEHGAEVKAFAPSGFSLLPALLSIVLALVTRSVLPALFCGIWCGAWLIAGNDVMNVIPSFFSVFDSYILDALFDRDRLSIVCFTLMLGGMVGILSKNGGMEGLVGYISKHADTPRKGQVAITSLGFAIFFDDTANTLLIGKTMRPLSDRLKISREKLAYLVDSTAAPLSAIAFATTWIGYEISLISSAGATLEGFPGNSYRILLNSLVYCFYPILTLVFVWCVAISGRDFGPMLAAEKQARAKDIVINSAVETNNLTGKSSALNALLPIGVIVLSLISGLLITGEGASFQERIGSADSFKALMWSSLAGVAAAAAMAFFRRVLSLEQIVEAWSDGMRATAIAMVILVLAWALADIMGELRAAEFIVSWMGDDIPSFLLPTLVFLIAAAIAFTTGTSWGAMGIVIPLALPIAWAFSNAEPNVAYLLPATIAAVMSGAVFGDHCSPISDTTVLSSVASECDHIEHVRTQIPYAIIVATISILFCTIPVGLGAQWWACLGLSCLIVPIIIIILGRKT